MRLTLDANGLPIITSGPAPGRTIPVYAPQNVLDRFAEIVRQRDSGRLSEPESVEQMKTYVMPWVKCDYNPDVDVIQLRLKRATQVILAR